MANMQEKTDLIAPIETDMVQPLSISSKCLDENFEENNEMDETSHKKQYFWKMNDNDLLDTVSLTELYDNVYPPKRQIISNLINAGAYLFAGAPKVGKSFLMAQIGYHISCGIPLWGNSIEQGTVLYLALEDNYVRLQKRLSRMFGTDSTEKFHFATQAKQLNSGLEGQLNKFITEYPDLCLVIIDTLQKIRENGAEKYSYSSDYEIITKLKHFADHHNICIILVHHTRKQGADDSFDTISGTNGLLGAADGAFIMQKEKRTNNEATLDIVGRDQQDQRFRLLFDRERCTWQLTKTETELWKEPVDPVLESVSRLVNDESSQWTGSATEIIEMLGLDIQPNALTRKLNIGVDRLWNEYSIYYESSRSHNGRQVKLILATCKT